jgi:hypothetical protein
VCAPSFQIIQWGYDVRDGHRPLERVEFDKTSNLAGGSL